MNMKKRFLKRVIRDNNVLLFRRASTDNKRSDCADADQRPPPHPSAPTSTHARTVDLNNSLSRINRRRSKIQTTTTTTMNRCYAVTRRWISFGRKEGRDGWTVWGLCLV